MKFLHALEMETLHIYSFKNLKLKSYFYRVFFTFLIIWKFRSLYISNILKIRTGTSGGLSFCGDISRRREEQNVKLHKVSGTDDLGSLAYCLSAQPYSTLLARMLCISRTQVFTSCFDHQF